MDIYDELGVRKIINGYATLTSLGGSLMPTEVSAAMLEAARHFVRIDELQEKVGQKIAAWTQNEAAYVSCGAAAGIVLSVAACITGLDPFKRERLPFTDGMKNEIIAHRRGVEYDFTIQQAGGRLVLIGTDQGTRTADLEQAINDRTAAIFVVYKNERMDGQVPLEEQIAIGKRRGIPVIVDAAAQLPPVENLWGFTQMGASLVLFSGGKRLCGPQSSGLILGRRELIDACAFNASPRSYIGRPMKVGKEEIVGLMAAVHWYLNLDQAGLLKTYEEQVSWIVVELSSMAHVHARRGFPSEAGQPMPRAEILLDEEQLGVTRDDLLSRLSAGSPSISLAPAGERGIMINIQTLSPGQERMVVERIRAILAGAS